MKINLSPNNQFIMVMEDALADKLKETPQMSSSSSSLDGADSNVVEWVEKILIGSTIGPAIPAVMLIQLAKEAVRRWDHARNNGLKINVIGRTFARSLVFPPGHPRDDVLYIRHPAMDGVYFVPSNFHRVVFEHKFCEALEILMSLGALEIQVEHVRGWSNEFSAQLSVPLGSVDASAGVNRTSGSRLLYKAELSGTTNPCLPPDLVWYPHEPTWQAIANGRLKYGLRNFSMSVSYEDDFGVNAGLKLAVAKSGFDLGGKFEDHESTIWKIEGRFT